MIIETLTSATIPARTPFQQLAKRLGYTHESIAISARHTRNFLKWRPHLKACKQVIASAISGVPASGRIVILGSGSWLDLPVTKLARHGAQIDLVEIVHLPVTRAKARLFPTFNLIETDLTGYASAWDVWDETSEDMPTPPENAQLPLEGADLVISLNILSQLPLAFVSSPPENGAEADLARRLQQAHVSALSLAPGRVILIADYHRTEISDEILEIPTVPGAVLPGKIEQTWKWHIAPPGEVRKDTDIKLQVGVWADFNKG